MNAVQQLLTDHIDIWTAAETEKRSGRGRASGNAASVYGIKKLRELILELAVRGKLVEQNDDDEPATELLKRIQTERAKFVAEKRTRKGQPLSPIENQEKTFDLPCGWEWVRLGHIGDWGAGATPLRSKSSYYGGTTPWFKSGELTADFIDSSEETITELALQECSLRLNQPGDLLIAMYGATIGKTAILKIEGTTNQAVCACTPNTGVLNLYLLVLLKAMRSNFIGQGAGGAQPNISREKIIATVIALPSTEEQHRIVAKVDELMALCDQLEAQHSDAADAHEQLVSHLLGTLTQSQSAADFNTNWQRIAAHFNTLFTTEASIDALKQTLLQLAIMGKLVSQDANDEPASELLKRVHVEKNKLVSEGKIKKEKPFPTIADDKKISTKPLGWEIINFGEIMELISGQHLNPSEYFEKEENNSIPYITGPADFSDNGPIPSRHTRERRAIASCGDILVTVKGSGVGKTNSVHQDELAISRQLMAVRPILINISFVDKLLLTLAQVFQDSTVGIAIPGISREDVLHAQIALPPLAEQIRIVAKIDELMEICCQLRASITGANQQQKRLADVLVKQAVMG